MIKENYKIILKNKYQMNKEIKKKLYLDSMDGVNSKVLVNEIH